MLQRFGRKALGEGLPNATVQLWASFCDQIVVYYIRVTLKEIVTKQIYHKVVLRNSTTWFI